MYLFKRGCLPASWKPIIETNKLHAVFWNWGSKLKIDLIDKLTIIFFVQSTSAVAQCTLCVERIDEIPMSPLPILGGCL